MKTIRKITAIVMVLIMALSLTACGDTSWIVKVDDTTVNSGVYIYYQTIGYSDAVNQLAAEDINYYYMMMYGQSLLEEKLGEQTVEDYTNEYALSMCKQYVVVEKLFDELGLELTDEDLAKVKAEVNNLWKNSSEALEKAGIGKASVEKIAISSLKEEKIFNSYYEVGGTNGTTEDDIKGYLAENYVRAKYITIPYADSADDAVDAARKSEAEAKAQGYLDRLNAGEAMNDIIEEYNAEEAAKAEEDSADETAEDNAANEDADEPADEPAEDAAVEDAEAEEEHVHEEYEHETIFNKEAKNPSEKFVNYLFTEVKTGEAKLLQDDLNIYVVEKLDVLERTDIYDNNRSYLLNQLFDSDFTSLINEKLAGYKVSENQNSIKRYTAKKALGFGKAD